MGHRPLPEKRSARASAAAVLHAGCGHPCGVSAASSACRTGAGVCRLRGAVVRAPGGIQQVLTTGDRTRVRTWLYNIWWCKRIRRSESMDTPGCGVAPAAKKTPKASNFFFCAEPQDVGGRASGQLDAVAETHPDNKI